MTLCLVYDHPKILLGMKKRGFGEGRWNGFGGKVEEGERIHEAAKRELKEEADIEVENPKQVGILEFSWAGKSDILEVNIFRADYFTGEPKESEEMRPQWFHVDKIPFDDMWPDDKHWMPLFLADKKFTGSFLFGDSDKILKHNIAEVEFI